MGRIIGLIALTLLVTLLMVHAQPRPLREQLETGVEEHKTNESLEKLHGEAGEKRVKSIMRKGGGGGGGRGGGGRGARGGGGTRGGGSSGPGRWWFGGGGHGAHHSGGAGHHNSGAKLSDVNSHWWIFTCILSLWLCSFY